MNFKVQRSRARERITVTYRSCNRLRFD